GFETPFGLELFSTVYWVARHEGAASAETAMAATYAWNDRKRQFSRTQIEMAWQRLYEGHWLRPIKAPLP
ncbi:MAG: type II toxin-antitoxin system antitoxin DNA ADP-ribosyl glycohydrolase DarG, partial [Acidiferrobacter sp.]